MPPDLDIYGLTQHRDATTIDRFLDEYVDRAAAEDRGDEELALTPLMGRGMDWEPAFTLVHIVERGLDHPRRSFSTYHPSSHPNISRAILSFTEDDQLVLGLSIDDAGAMPENEARARSLLANLLEVYDCHMGLIIVESPPPLSETQFREVQAMPLAVYFTNL